MLNPLLPSSGTWSTALRTYLPSGERTPRAAQDQPDTHTHTTTVTLWRMRAEG